MDRLQSRLRAGARYPLAEYLPRFQLYAFPSGASWRFSFGHEGDVFLTSGGFIEASNVAYVVRIFGTEYAVWRRRAQHVVAEWGLQASAPPVSTR